MEEVKENKKIIYHFRNS